MPNDAERWRAEVLALADELDTDRQRERGRYDPGRVQYSEGACDAYDRAEQRVRALVARLDTEEGRDG